MAATFPIITLSVSANADGSFVVSGVFWLTAPANAQVPNPTAPSLVSGIAATDLAAIRAGTVVEQGFTTGAYASGTTQATVDADLQARFTAAQNALTNPGLSTALRRAFNGTTWAAYTGVISGVPIGGQQNLPIITEIYTAIAMGLLPNIKAGRAAGYVSTAATAGVKVRATAYSPAAPGVAAQRSLSSSSASDAPAGTGALTVTINYLTTAFVLKSETVTLNGTTVVNTVNTDIAYIENIVVATTGSNLANVGIITLFNATAGGGGALGSIAAGDNQTFWAHHYVPAGVTCFIINIAGGSAGATAVAGQVTINRTGNPSATNLPQIGIGGIYPHLAGGNEDHPFLVPIAVPGPDLIVLVEKPSAATASNAFATFEYFQV
jgi:hypothetical protein